MMSPLTLQMISSTILMSAAGIAPRARIETRQMRKYIFALHFTIHSGGNGPCTGFHSGSCIAQFSVTMIGKSLLVMLLGFTVQAGGGAQQVDRASVIGRPITPWLILRQGLADDSADHRRQALLAAASIGATPESLKFLEEGLKDK